MRLRTHEFHRRGFLYPLQCRPRARITNTKFTAKPGTEVIRSRLFLCISLSHWFRITYLFEVCRYALNPYRELSPPSEHAWASVFGDRAIQSVHRSLPEYTPTPTITLPRLARSLGVKQILVKDESHRFGLKAFKALGASYAVYRFFKQYLEAHGQSCPPASEFYSQDPPAGPGTFTFCTATDGNHGRGVAWVARKLRQRAVIYMPHGTVQARIENIEAEGAEVIVIDGSYDEAVSRAAADADRHGWQIISDTSWPGYEEIPRWIMGGYTTMFREIHEAPSAWPIPDVVIVQGGVGALAAAAAWYYRQSDIAHRPKLVCVEPTSAACLLESIESTDGEPVRSQGKQDSIMAGLNCGTPSLLAWPIVKRGFDLFVGVSDDHCIRAMQSFYHAQGNDPRIISGESGAAGLAALLALTNNESLRPARTYLGLGVNSAVLLLNTEGDTDPVGFREVVLPV